MKTVKHMLWSTMAVVSLLNAGGNVASVVEEVKPVETSSWSQEFQLYALAVWIQGDSELGYKTPGIVLPSQEGSLPPGNIDVGPDNIVKNLKMGAMAHYEAHHNSGWGVWLDYVFMDLGKSPDSGFEYLNVQDVGAFQGILEAFATYRTPLEDGYVDYFGGVRWWHMNLDMTMAIAGETFYPQRTFDWYDPVIGAVWVTPLNENWSFRVRGDVGGFGIASNFTSAIEIGALYDINEKWQVDLRLKSLWVDYEEGTQGKQDRFTYDTVSFGPIIGITYRF